MSNLKSLKYSIQILIKDSLEDSITPEEAVLMLEEIADDIRKDPIPTGLNEDPDPDPGDMDGDHASSLASAGWGTDEDYGGGDERM